MVSLTRSNVAHDLNISPHIFEVMYKDFSLFYYFSSDLYKGKFAERLMENRGKINESLSNRFGVEIEFDVLADLRLYTTIEKRGFLIVKDGEKIECLDKLKLSGQKLMRLD